MFKAPSIVITCSATYHGDRRKKAATFKKVDIETLHLNVVFMVSIMIVTDTASNGHLSTKICTVLMGHMNPSMKCQP